MHIILIYCNISERIAYMGHKICYLEVCSFPTYFYGNGQQLSLLGATYLRDFNVLKNENFN